MTVLHRDMTRLRISKKVQKMQFAGPDPEWFFAGAG
jgi:hypothetical protein